MTSTSATGRSTATSQAITPWRRSPPLKDCSSQAPHAASVPCTAARSPSGRHCSMTRAAMMATTLTGGRSRQDSIKVDEHPRRGSPDHPPVVLDHVIARAAAGELARLAAVIARVENEGERHLEHLVH